jgi:hypothetical protein
MLFWTSRLRKWSGKVRDSHARQPKRTILAVERLEDRCLLAAPPWTRPPIMVTTVKDDGNDQAGVGGGVSEQVPRAFFTPAKSLLRDLAAGVRPWWSTVWA